MSDTEPIRVVLAGDCPLLRSGFRQVLVLTVPPPRN